MMIKKWLTLLLSFLISFPLFSQEITDFLTPTPQQIEISSHRSIPYSSYTFSQIYNYLSQLYRGNLEGTIAFHNSGKGIISLELQIDNKKFNPQHYAISIESKKITIIGGDEAALFYGIQTLKQIFSFAIIQKNDIPFLEIVDYPNFERRGYMLDISRDKVPTMESLIKLVDFLAQNKINEFQLYTEHSFAYRDHEEVWKEASPMTAAEIRALDTFCKERFIDLVPNQNSFGHFENWLKHKTYQSLAECPDDCATKWGKRKLTSLDPTNPLSFILVKSLYDELLPNFSSPYFNIGCDETVELGLGNSKAICDSLGVGTVYLNYLIKLNTAVNKCGKEAQFWGDIIINHPELIASVPKNMTALAWGYDQNFPFDTILPKFKKADLHFYVCPGTSTWRSIIGRQTTAFNNLKIAAIEGTKNNAEGYLITNWGDYGHWQPLSVCYPAIIIGTNYAWNCDTTAVNRIELYLNHYVFQDPSQNLGKAVMKLGNAYLKTHIPEGVANAFHLLLRRYEWTMKGNYQTKELTIENLDSAQTEIKAALQLLETAKPECEDADIVIAELKQAANLALHAIHLGIARLNAPEYDTKAIPLAQRKILADELKPIIDNHRKVWIMRNRPGGLNDSAAKLEEILDFYLK